MLRYILLISVILISTSAYSLSREKVTIIFKKELNCNDAMKAMSRTEVLVSCVVSKKKEKLRAYNGLYYGKVPFYKVKKKISKNKLISLITHKKKYLLESTKKKFK